jgi:hypothetical protein
MGTQRPYRNRFLERRRQLLERLHTAHFETPYEPWTKPLSARQQRILGDTEDVIKGLQNFTPISGEEIENDKKLRQRLDSLIDELDSSMLKAHRAGLKDHPHIKYWHDVMRSLGQRELLRRAKRSRAEKGVKAPLQIGKRQYDEIVKLAQEGKSWKAIRVELMEHHILPRPYSRNAFYELRQRLGVPSRNELEKS